MASITSPTTKHLFREALQLHASGALQSALDAYQCILCVDPADLAVLGHMATGLGQVEDPFNALLWFERARAAAPGRSELATNHATALLSLGAISRATIIAKSGLILQPSRSKHYVNLVKTKTTNGLETPALEILRKATLLEPLRADLHAWVAELNLKAQRLESAMQSILKAIQIEPENSRNHFIIGKLSQKAGADLNAQRFFQRSVRISPFDVNARYWLAEGYRTAKQFDSAQKAFIAAALLAPHLVKPILGLAQCLIDTGHFQDALPCIKRAQLIAPLSPTILSLGCKTLINAGRYPEALAALHHCIVLFPDFQDAYLQLSALETMLDHPIRALKLLGYLEATAPSLPAASLCRGDALMRAGYFKAAIPAYEIAIENQVYLSEAYTGKGIAEFKIGWLEGALSSFNHALEVNSDAHEARIHRGNTFLVLMRFDAALEDFDAALGAGGLSSGLCINRGNTLFALNRLEDALESYKKALKIDPSLIEGYTGLAAVHQKCRRYREALRAHECVFSLSHQDPIYLGSLIYCSMKSWAREKLDTYLREGLVRIDGGTDIGTPFPLLTAIDDPFTLRKAAALHGESLSEPQAPPQAYRRSTFNDPRITIAYFSSDLDTSHPVGVNLHPLIRAHDRQRFRLLAFNLSENAGADLLPFFDAVHQAHNLSDAGVAELARSQGVDIAVDVNGYTEGARTSIFAFRPAPVQINFLGYPGTMGTSFHDFIVADAQVIPESVEHAYTEKVLRLPHFFMPYDFSSSEGNPTPQSTRDDFALPRNAFVFCSFNDFHKITQEMLSTWIQILRETQDTVLWFALRGEISQTELRTIFESQGIRWERIILAKRVETAKQHLARLRLADLMLDTFPYNSHTTACDAINSGLPVLTLSGDSFQSRVCSSLLHSLGSHMLIARSMSEYKEIAVALTRDANWSAKVKAKTLDGRSKLIAPKNYALAIEKLYASTLNLGDQM